MSDFKSKLPDLNELGSMASKLFKGLKSSVEEIIEDYKAKRSDSEEETERPAKAKKETKSSKKTK